MKKTVLILLATIFLMLQTTSAKAADGNIIYYTTIDGELLPTSPKMEQLLSHSYENGQGKLIFKNDIGSISERAFYSCTKLQTVILPSTVTRIEKSAFQSCHELTSIDISSNVKFICDEAFSDCRELRNIVLSPTLSSIGKKAFCNCKNITSLNIPIGVREIGEEAFCGCGYLNDLTIDLLSPIYINPNVFYDVDLDSLKVHVLPNALASFSADPFWGKLNLVPRNNYLCYSTNNGQALTLQGATPVEGATQTGYYYANPIGWFVFDKDITQINASAFFSCTSLTEITLPSTLTVIGERVFSNCSALQSIDLPSGLTTIGQYAFAACNKLTAIDIPSSVTCIGNQAFRNCSKIDSITVHTKTPQEVYDNTFLGVPEAATLYVPIGAKEAYSKAIGWKKFKNIVEIDDLLDLRKQAIAALDSVVGSISETAIDSVHNTYASLIETAETQEIIISYKEQGVKVLSVLVECYQAGYRSLVIPSEGEQGHGVRIILDQEGKESKSIELMNPTNVQFFKKE